MTKLERLRLLGEQRLAKSSDGGVESRHAVAVVQPRGIEPEVASGPSEAKFDRNAYQREYMRKRRTGGKGYQRKTEGPTNKGRPCK